jgi:GAF domain-containing protein
VDSTRSEAMIAVSAALNRALDVDEVATAIFEHVARRMGAATVGLWILDENRGTLRLAGNAGYPAGTLDSVAEFAVDAAVPGAEVIRTREAVRYGSREERDERWPELRDTVSVMPAGCVLPLFARDRPLGALGLGYRDPEVFEDPDEWNLLLAAAEQCALALDRAVLYDTERDARETLEFLARSTALMTSALEPRDVLERLLDLAVPRLADACLVYVERDGLLHRVAARVRDVTAVDNLLNGEPVPVERDTPLSNVYRTGEVLMLHDLSGEIVDAAYPGRAADVHRFGLSSAAIVPLVARGTTMGAVSFAFGEAGRSHDADLVYAVTGFAARAAIALDNARRFTDERSTARTLVQALLPATLPAVDGYELAALYVPTAGYVGGDWYDALQLPGDALLLGVGDIAGHGVSAAAQMSELRHVARALAMSRRRPRAILTQLARFSDESEGERSLATVAYVRIDLSTGRGRWASAGHPPALVVRGRRARYLHAPHGPALGVSKGSVYTDSNFGLEPGELLVLYTDGVVERRGEHFDVGLTRLADTVVANRDAKIAELADTLVDQLCNDPDDDCCLVLLRRLA